MPEHIQELLRAAAKSVSTEDFIKLSKALREVIAEALTSLTNRVDEKLRGSDEATKEAWRIVTKAQADLDEVIAQTKEANVTTLGILKKRAVESLDALFQKMRLQDKFDALTSSLVSDLEDKIQALDAAILDVPKVDVKQLALDAAALIPQDEESAAELRDKLESLEGDERLDVSAIKGLDEFVKKATPQQSGGTNFVISRGAVRAYDLSDQLDGLTTTFSLPAFWRVISVHLSSFPTIMRPGVDYTVDAAAMTIAFTIDAASLAAGQTLIVVYAEG